MAATALGALAAGSATVAAARPVAAGALVDLNLGVVNVSVTTPALPPLPPPVASAPGLPALLPPAAQLPPSLLPTLPPLLPSSAPAVGPPPGLPGGTSPSQLCPPTCTINGAGVTTGGPSAADPGAGTATRAVSRSAGGPTGPVGLGTGGAGSSATNTLVVPPSVGLAVAPPPTVEALTPLAGISFGQAPYLWPLFLLLDVVAACAVVFLVRRTWSSTSGAD